MSRTALGRSRVLIVGVGGLGCPASLVLARAGVGALTLMDPDRVDPTNLHRQLWHGSEDVGRPKVESAAEKLKARFPETSLQVRAEAVTPENVDGLFAAHDLVIDGSDGVEAKFLFSDAAVRTGVPLVYGGVLRMHGQAMVVRRGGPCLRCLFESPPSNDDVPTCAQAGVLGSLAGIIGALQGVLAGQWLAETRVGYERGRSTLHTFDGMVLRARRVEIRQRSDCPACLGDPSESLVHGRAVSAEGAAACRR